LSGLADALTRPRYEVYAAAGIAAAVAEHVPKTVKVTVTSSEARGLDATIALAEELATIGYEAAPHLAARLVLDRPHLGRILGRLETAGVEDVFVIAGDAKEPHGEFRDAVALLQAMYELGHVPKDIGFVGYPEPHPFLSDEALAKAFAEKARYASYVVTQICFRPDAIEAWISGLRRDGITLPVHVGIAGAVERERLSRVLSRLGLDDATPTDGSSEMYTPDSLIDNLASLDDPAAAVGGFHVYTFNELAETERWRRAKLARETVAQGTLT
jgi:methylenetetrahydrofolate reductase (NADPH)